MTLNHETIIRKPIQEVWEVLGGQFAEAHRWASGLHHSEGFGQRGRQAICDERACDINGMGWVREKVIEFDPQSHVLAYDVIGGFPFFVKSGKNRWQLVAEGVQTRVIMKAEIETQGIVGMLMRPMLGMQMGQLLRITTDDLKYFLEEGQVHPRKAEALKKHEGRSKQVPVVGLGLPS